MQAEFGCAWEHNFLFDKNTVPVLGNNDDKQVPCAALHVYRANGDDALVRVRSQHVRASFLRIGNINSYSMKTQYLYWEPTTTNKYRAQPQVRVGEPSPTRNRQTKYLLRTQRGGCVRNVGTCAAPSTIAFKVANGEFFCSSTLHLFFWAPVSFSSLGASRL